MTSGGPIQNAPRDADRALRYYIGSWNQQLDDFALFPSHMATISLGVLGAMGAMLAITGVLAMQLLGLFATWIPAQRALAIDPLTLLREK